MEADLGTTHEEPEPRDGQLVDEPTSTTEVGTRIHQVTLWTKPMTPLAKLPVKKTQDYRAPAVVTRLVLVTEAVDPHPGDSVTHGIGEENVGKQV